MPVDSGTVALSDVLSWVSRSCNSRRLAPSCVMSVCECVRLYWLLAMAADAGLQFGGRVVSVHRPEACHAPCAVMQQTMIIASCNGGKV